MPAPKHRGECTLKLGALNLKLRFKAHNLWVLTDITGKTPIEFFERFEGIRTDEVGAVAKKVCDFAFIVPLVMAGLADHPEYEHVDLKTLRRKVCKLLDAEAEQQGKSILALVADVASEVLPVAIGSLGVVADAPEETPSPNEQAPEAAS